MPGTLKVRVGTEWKPAGNSTELLTDAVINANATTINANITNLTPSVPANTAALVALLGTGKPVILKEGTISLGSGFTIPDNSVIEGAGRGKTILSHDFSGDLITMGANVTLKGMTIEGNGATRTGRGLTYPNNKGKQHLEDVEVINFDGPCEYYEVSGGSLAKHTRCMMYRISAGTGTGRYAVVVDPAQQLAAVPRSFVQLDTGGQCAFDFGGCNNTYISASTIGDLAYTSESRAVLISTSRILNQAALNFQGHGNVINACDVNPVITVMAGTQSASIKGNAYNNAPYVIDNARVASNQLDLQMQSYTPVMTSGGVAPSLGNGVILGSWSRSGTAITVAIDLVLGSTTSLGTGDFRFSLPSMIMACPSVQTGAGYAYDLSTLTNHPLVAVAAQTQDFVSFRFAGAGPVTYNTPFIFATGDTIRVTMTYLI